MTSPRAGNSGNCQACPHPDGVARREPADRESVGRATALAFFRMLPTCAQFASADGSRRELMQCPDQGRARPKAVLPTQAMADHDRESRARSARQHPESAAALPDGAAMSRTDSHSLIDRLFLAHRAFQSARLPIATAALQAQLGDCSRKQLRRTIFHLRDILGAPLQYDPGAHGWHYDRSAPAFELPGLWFTSTELHALLAAGQLLAQADPGILASAIAPLRARIAQLLQRGGLDTPWRHDAVRVNTPMLRRADRRVFALVAQATLSACQLRIRYRARSHAGDETRTVSPLRLEHYRGNWYLRAWCHVRAGWRFFALERIETPELLGEAATFPEPEPASPAFGLFEGTPPQSAVLRFARERARWIADEEWHPRQQQRWLADGRLELEIPFGDPTELLLDILRYGPDVEVAAPESLRDMVRQRLQQALAIYHSADPQPPPVQAKP